jgi:hypothetical protein
MLDSDNYMIQNLQHLQTALGWIDGLIQESIQHATDAGQSPNDQMRGLIITEEDVENYLSQTPLSGIWLDEKRPSTEPIIPDDVDPNIPFIRLINQFEFDALDAYILLVCLAPELDRRYQRLYSFLQDDVTLRRPTVNLVMNILGGSLEQRYLVWDKIKANSPLRQHRVIDVVKDPGKPNMPLLTQQLRVDDRVIHYLLGDNEPDSNLLEILSVGPFDKTTNVPDAILNPIYQAIPSAPIIYMRGLQDMGQEETAAALCDPYDIDLVVFDAKKLEDIDLSFEDAWRLSLREGYLRSAGFMVLNWESLLQDEYRQPPRAMWRAMLDYPLPIFLCGEKDWEPIDNRRDRRLLRMTFAIPEYHDRLASWQQLAKDVEVEIDEQVIDELASKFRFNRRQIVRSIHTASDIAASNGQQLSRDELYMGVQAHASLQLGQLAKRVVPKATWGELILPDEQMIQLQEMVKRAQFAHIVEDWGYKERYTNMYGISALFAGESGTGKTLSAQVIAKELGLVMYRIDLSAVVSKYIGETEKNLARIFTEAHSSNAILFFDEADALFGKRSEVKDARDRYANIEVAYLLQQIEEYDGVAIMATNLRQNLDDAFTRRLDFMIDFPFPDPDYRTKLWMSHFPKTAPLADDIDIELLAQRYHLAGGNIRNAALAAAFLAASDGGVITNLHIQSAIRREHQKMGRLLQD